MLNLHEHGHMTLFIVPTVYIVVIKVVKACILVKKIVGQTTVPVFDYFVDFFVE
jgi:hypothetical protein